MVNQICYTEGMTETDIKIRKAIRHRMVDLELNQAQLAERMQISKQNVNAIFLGRRGLLSKSLLEVLDTLGLELVAVPKQE